ncbi:MAG: redoxin domain-containing protein, partial [Acidobacteria bacterium]|nr:redoxin domain-containing protein [Acidobacteriota bacterium]
MKLPHLLATVLILLGSAWAQAPAPLSPEEEERILKETVSQVGNSPVDFIRAVERHLRKYPQSPRKKDLERAVFTAAVDAKDNARVISYGEKVLEQGDDLVALDRVARALLNSDDAESARRSLRYSERLEKAARAAAKEDADRTMARALALQARGWGNRGDLDKAIALARKSYETYPTGEAAREAGRWEVRLGRVAEAIERYADAFSIPDPAVTDENRKHHRALMGELYRKLHGSEAGLGDLILRAYDRTSQAVAAHEARLKSGSPNAGLQDAFEFRLAGLRGDSMRLADFRGKVIILDFWATWCAPCRFMHPLFEQLKAKYQPNPNVVFLSIN